MPAPALHHLLRALPSSAATVAVRLVGVVPHRQGAHDSLCAYYAAATALCALHPWLAPAFEAARAREDPLFPGLPRRGRTLDAVVTGALFSGLHLRDVCTAMNRAGTGSAFRYAVRGADALHDVAAQVLEGLPVVLGWEGPEIGSHTAVVTGVRAARGTRRTWLDLADPSGQLDTVEWTQLMQLAGGEVETVACTRHHGVRPDRAWTVKDGASRVLTAACRVERHDARTGTWTALVRPGE